MDLFDTDSYDVVLTLSHPLVARAEHPAAEALLAPCCPHDAVPALVRDGVVSLFLPLPQSTVTVFVALVLRTPEEAGGDGGPARRSRRLAALTAFPTSSFYGDGTTTDVVHVVEGCDTAATTRRVLNATQKLARVQPRGAVPNAAFLAKKRGPLSSGSDDDVEDKDDSNGSGGDDSVIDIDSPYAVKSQYQCCKDLDLSELTGEFAFVRLQVTPEVLRFPRGRPGDLVNGRPFFATELKRLVFHPDTLYTKIGGSVFCFTHVTTVDFRGLKQMPVLGNHVFQGCPHLTAVCMRGLPNLERIGDCIFVFCAKLRFADCRDCPELRRDCDRAFDGADKDLCVLVDNHASFEAVRESMAPVDRNRAKVLTVEELDKKQKESGDPLLYRCPVCEPSFFADPTNACLSERVPTPSGSTTSPSAAASSASEETKWLRSMGVSDDDADADKNDGGGELASPIDPDDDHGSQEAARRRSSEPKQQAESETKTPAEAQAKAAPPPKKRCVIQ